MMGKQGAGVVGVGVGKRALLIFRIISRSHALNKLTKYVNNDLEG